MTSAQILNVKFKVRSLQTGRVYDADFIIERPAGQYGLVWAHIAIYNDLGAWYESYKATVTEALDDLRQQLDGKWAKLLAI